MARVFVLPWRFWIHGSVAESFAISWLDNELQRYGIWCCSKRCPLLTHFTLHRPIVIAAHDKTAIPFQKAPNLLWEKRVPAIGQKAMLTILYWSSTIQCIKSFAGRFQWPSTAARSYLATARCLATLSFNHSDSVFKCKECKIMMQLLIRMLIYTAACRNLYEAPSLSLSPDIFWIGHLHICI